MDAIFAPQGGVIASELTTDKRQGIYSGALGTVEAIDGAILHVRSDLGRMIAVDTRDFTNIDLGYAGTIYRGQGKTLDQTYLLHTRHWRDSSSYVAMTRARGETRVYVATDQARDLGDLAHQMGRQQNRGSSLRFSAQSEAVQVQAAAHQSAAGRVENLRKEKLQRSQIHEADRERE